jgi:hypothetical protein
MTLEEEKENVGCGLKKGKAEYKRQVSEACRSF